MGPPAQAAPPRVSQLVVFRDGSAKAKSAISTRAAKVRVGGGRCAAADGTALAALVRSKPGRLRLRDFGTCSLRASDGGGLFVRGIRGDANRGQDGWVYKVGRRAATAGAADPAGPSGAAGCARASGSPGSTAGCGRAASGRSSSSCRPSRDGVASVRGYDDAGDGVAGGRRDGEAAGRRRPTGASGVARLDAAGGQHRVVAEQGRPRPLVRGAGRGAVRRAAAPSSPRASLLAGCGSARARSRRAAPSSG